ncbi:MAG: hypothetical protein U1E15_12710 [Hyphomicrobiales bacterium]
MTAHVVGRSGALAFTAALILAAACGDSGEISRISEEMKLNEKQQYAFSVCARDLKGKRMPIFQISGKDMKMTRVPLEVCGCQSKTLAAVFKDDPSVKAAHPGFVSFAAKKKKIKFPKLDEKLITEGVKKEDGMKMLWDSFTACTTQYQSQFPKRALTSSRKSNPRT